MTSKSGLFHVLDVNGDFVLEFDDETEAERYADKYFGYHVVEIKTRTRTTIRSRTDLAIDDDDPVLFEVNVPSLILSEREIDELADKLIDWGADDVAGALFGWLEDRASGKAS